ncbi:MAG: DNA-binding NtrC family response regulator [Gammaproteobacteria bacterium]|jgi:DNA-binding NtrC family response regulator
MMTEILFVDDDPLIVETLTIALEDEFIVYAAESREQTKKLIRKLDKIPSIALIDLGLPPHSHHPDEGFKLIQELLVFNSDIKILVLSGQNETTNIQHALTLGAVDFVSKPCDIPLLRSRLKHQQMMLDAEQIQEAGASSGKSLLGESQAIKTLHEIIKQFANTPFPVLIEGESGSGKELVSKFIHEQSARAKAPFLTINCAAFSSELLEAQLFGYAKGAYTGATKTVAGFFEDSGDGSLVLDEIGEMPVELQSKLLRVLENGEYYRLGETAVRVSRARIIAVTNRDVREEVRTGRFRQDLYHRLSVLTINVPPLRERDTDSLLLMEHFKILYAINNNPFELDDQAEQRISNYSFPGNVRELRNICIRLNSKYPGVKVKIDQLNNELESQTYEVNSELVGEYTESLKQEMLEKEFSLENNLSEWERRYINTALEMSGGNLSKAARYLGINRTTLYSRLQRLSIKIP